MLNPGETLHNFQEVLEEYNTALRIKQEHIDKLNDEIKIIKKLKV